LDWCVPDSVGSTASDNALWEQLSQALAAQYELEHEVGRGGMGIVYRARDRRLKRLVAIKLLPPELAFRAEIRTRFLREAETAAQLSHPNIVPIYTVGEQSGLVFFVMALVEGETVASALATRGTFSTDATRRVIREVADALAYAHARGVVHRDIKPDNILLDGETGRALVTDFGIARAMTGEDSGEGSGAGSISRLTATGIAIGTPAYMSPEQSAGERTIDGRSDLYSLGVVGYQMLCGEPPFTASNTPALLMKHLTETPVSISERRADVPPELGRAIMMLLAKEPANRFPSAAALAAALEPGSVAAEDARVRHDAASSVAGVPAYSPTGQRPGTRPAPSWGDMQAGAGGSSSIGEDLIYQPTEDELRRWHAPPVMNFRRRLAYYVSVNLVIVLLAILGWNNKLFLTGCWSVFMAFQYAKLSSDGFDRRDVFRQPRHREILDVASEAIDDATSLFDPNKRQQLRDRARRRIGMGERTPTTPRTGAVTAGSPVPALPSGLQRPADAVTPTVVRQAEMDRDEILRIVESLPRSERSKIPEVVASANALVDRIRSLAIAVTETGRDGPGIGAAEIDEEISQLESEANPLDRVASEKRVRRLAFLKRQRRAVADVEQRRSQASARLEGCAMALQSMRLDVLRLRAGALSHQHITSIAEQALTLARDVDSAMYVADEMARLTGRDPTSLRPDRA
jgi:serine/threonine-protein kinase